MAFWSLVLMLVLVLLFRFNPFFAVDVDDEDDVQALAKWPDNPHL